jgi:hypothetical protein
VASALMYALQTVSGNQPRIRRIIEKAGQTFLAGTPVVIDTASGAMIAWGGSTTAFGIAGITKEPGSNLGATPPTPLTTTIGIGGPAGAQGAKVLSFGAVPFQTAALNIPRGAPINDGRIGFEVADPDTVFYGQVGPSQTTVATDVGTQYGMTIDSDNHWFVDKTKTGGTVVCTIVKLDPNDLSATPRGVYFTFLQSAAQIIA